MITDMVEKDSGDIRVNVAYCVEDVETVAEYSKVRSEERGIGGSVEVYEEGINKDGATKDRALVLISIGFDDYGTNLHAYSTDPPVPPPGDAFLEKKGITFLRKHIIFEKSRTVTEVGMDKQAFVDDEKAKVFDGEVEVKALEAIFADTEITNVCASKLNARWAGVVEKFKGKKWTGEDIKGVVDKLDAPHLKPSGILERMRGGTDSGAFGVASLVTYL